MTKNNPSVSIVTLTQYKRFNTLEILFEIIKQQTYRNIIEWVIVEGSKTDNERNLNMQNMNKIINFNNDTKFKINYITDTQNMKLGALRNKGNNSCIGDITVCMDDDDFYFKDRVEHAVNKLMKSKYNIAGCSNHLMYDFQLNTLFQSKKFGEYHSINCCMAWKKKYLETNSCDPNKEFGEESGFTKNFSEPMVQLDPYSTIITMSHTDNTYNKKEIILKSYFDNETKTLFIINKPITKYIDNDLFKKYYDIFNKIFEKDYDIVYMCGAFSINWNPNDKSLGGSEQAVVNLSEYWNKMGKSVIVYGEVPECTVNGVDYKSWKKFDYTKKYKNIILWRAYGISTVIFYDIKADNIIIDLHDRISTIDFLYEKYSTKIDKMKIFFKSNYHKKLFISKFPYCNKDNFIVVSNGIRIEQFKNIHDKSIIRNPYRFCYCSCYTRGLEYILTNIWPTIYAIEPKSELHVYYGMENIQDQMYKIKLLQLLSQPGVMDHGRQPVELINREKHMSNFQLYITNTEMEIDCISIRESLVAGCIPLISNFGVFEERQGIHIDFDTEQNKKTAALKILKLLKDIDTLDNLREEFKKSHTILSWNEVAFEWIRHMKII